jgi:ornithine cyclodeaminase
MKLLTLSEAEIRGLIDPADALSAVREGFAALARGAASLPGVIGLEIPRHRGEVHVKGAWLHAAPFFSIKVANGFYGNPDRGLPVGSGLVLVFDAETGLLRALLFDNAYLTELRTGAAGALSIELLARREVRRAALLGCGSQARYQLEALLGVRRPQRVVVWGRDGRKAQAYARDMHARLGIDVETAATALAAVTGADLVVTTTPSRDPIVHGEWLAPGVHIAAVGSDGPDKQELDVSVLARADRVFADHLDQCLRLGEIHHAVASGVLRPQDVDGELGDIVVGDAPRRSSEDEITVADLTGVGVQDTAVASLVVSRALEQGVGRMIDVD